MYRIIVTVSKPNNEITRTVHRLADNAFIREDETVPDYQAYLTWVAEGNTAEEWNPDEEPGDE